MLSANIEMGLAFLSVYMFCYMQLASERNSHKKFLSEGGYHFPLNSIHFFSFVENQLDITLHQCRHCPNHRRMQHDQNRVILHYRLHYKLQCALLWTYLASKRVGNPKMKASFRQSRLSP